MAVAPDSGGGDGFPHVQGRYNSGEIVSGTGHTSGGPHSQSGLEQGVRAASNLNPVGFTVNLVSSITGGARKDVANALKPTDPDTLKDHAKKWNTISTKTSSYAEQVYGAMTALSTWAGDDADKAREVLRGLGATFSTASGASYTMSSQLGQMASTLKWAKDNYGDDGGIGGTAANVVTGGGEDDDAANAFQKLLKNFETSMGYMPTAVPYEVKDDAPSTNPFSPPPTPTPGGPVGPAPTAGGAGSAPHVGNPAGPHIEQPKRPPVHPPVFPPPPPHVDPPPPPHIDQPTPTGTDYPGAGTIPYTGGGAGISPGLDTSGSLAGYDGAGGGGASGSLAGGAGGDLPGGAGGAPGGGAGLGTGAGSGLGAGAGGGANGGLGAGGGGAAGGVAGGRGMMPMHGGGGNDDDERERTTWLNEDDDVWGAEENLPGVIH